MPGIQEVFVILFVFLLVFSPKIPHWARSLGQSLYLVRKNLKETQDELKELDKPKKTPPPV
jgi:Sec-independent protein translocase protein TatA